MSVVSIVLLGTASAVILIVRTLRSKPRAPTRIEIRERIRRAKTIREIQQLHREVQRMRSTDPTIDSPRLFEAIRNRRSQLKTNRYANRD